jgi:hypothetical protein
MSDLDLALAVSGEALKALLDNLVKKSKNPVSSKRDALDYLNGEYRRGNLALVLGAGVSMNYGLLSWNSLLQKLLISTFKDGTHRRTEASTVLASLFNRVFRPTPLIAGRYLNNFYQEKSSEDPLALIKEVRDNLYSEIKEDSSSPLISQIRRLCLAVGKNPNLKAIITYNFDDLIEHDLEKSGLEIRYRSIFEPGVHPDDDELPIFHVHGFLPREAALTSANKIVFSENFYHEQYNNFYDWSNLIQINTFSKSSCLMIGTSLTDPNQRRLLDIAKTIRGDDDIHHYCIRKRYSASDVSKSLDAVLQESPSLLGEKSSASLEKEETVKELIRVMESYEEKDAASFGVGTIWIKEHNEAANVLKELKSR